MARRLLLLVGTLETIGGKQIYDMQMSSSGRAAGDFAFDPLMLLKSPNAEKFKLAEPTHGRAAMLAFSGVVTHSAMPDAFGIGKAASRISEPAGHQRWSEKVACRMSCTVQAASAGSLGIANHCNYSRISATATLNTRTPGPRTRWRKFALVRRRTAAVSCGKVKRGNPSYSAAYAQKKFKPRRLRSRFRVSVYV